MKGVRIVTEASAGPIPPAAKLIGFPAQDDLRAAFFLGGSLEASTSNRKRGESGGALVGTPTVQPFSLKLKGATNFIRLPFSDFTDTSYMIVCRGADTHADGAHQPVMVGTSGGQYGSSIYRMPDRFRLVNYLQVTSTGVADTNTSDIMLAGDDTAWRCLYARVGPTSQGIGDLTADNAGVADKVRTEINTGMTRMRGTAPIAIGGQTGTAFTGYSDVACVLVWSKSLTEAERIAAYQKLKAIYNPRGLAI